MKRLIGKTIKKVTIKGIKSDDGEEYDDKPYLILEMEDGTVFQIIAIYGGYTGKSEDEYPRYIYVEKLKKLKNGGYKMYDL